VWCEPNYDQPIHRVESDRAHGPFLAADNRWCLGRSEKERPFFCALTRLARQAQELDRTHLHRAPEAIRPSR
jgi:hypothetical protein